ncbi:MAG: putative multidrug resistance protein [Actinomycetia bacterium]|nr:putative multidrug resistance protein [Actinomycetes bacterium]
MLVTFVASLDQTVVAAARYRIGESLKGLTAQAWVTTAFLITSTICVPVYGKLLLAMTLLAAAD